MMALLMNGEGKCQMDRNRQEVGKEAGFHFGVILCRREILSRG